MGLYGGTPLPALAERGMQACPGGVMPIHGPPKPQYAYIWYLHFMQSPKAESGSCKQMGAAIKNGGLQPF